MATFDQLMAEMKDLAELEKFANKQYKTILELNKKVADLTAEVTHLKSLLENSEVPVVGDMTKISSPNEPHEKIICEIQLAKLNEQSMQRELTAEESKKVETYSKILATFRNQKKQEAKPEETVPLGELLRMVSNEE